MNQVKVNVGYEIKKKIFLKRILNNIYLYFRNLVHHLVQNVAVVSVENIFSNKILLFLNLFLR